MHVNLGCGDHRAPAPWVNVDQYSGVHPDIVASITDLPFADGSVDAIYCGHVLEHLTLDEVPVALREIRRVLSGRACFVGPDYDRALADPEHHVLLDSIKHGGNRWPGDKHQWTSTGTLALELIAEVFPDAEEKDIYMLPEWPVVTPTTWQFAIVA